MSIGKVVVAGIFGFVAGVVVTEMSHKDLQEDLRQIQNPITELNPQEENDLKDVINKVNKVQEQQNPQAQAQNPISDLGKAKDQIVESLNQALGEAGNAFNNIAQAFAANNGNSPNNNIDPRINIQK